MKPGYTYIMGSHSGTLYTGVTTDLYLRVHQHKTGATEGFAKRYGCTRLLYYDLTRASASPSPGKHKSKAGVAKRS